MRINLKIVLLFVFVSLGTAMFVVGRQYSSQPVPPVNNQVNAASEATPNEAVRTAQVKSGDGRMLLAMKSQKVSDGENYSFRALDTSTNTEAEIFQKTVGSGVTLAIPFNSWSPDNKQLFVQENNPDGEDYFVFKADGSSFRDGAKFLDVGSYWNKAKYNYQIKTVSGWAAPDLLVVYVTKNDGTDGPSFWFVVSSRQFLPLRQL